MKTRTKLAIAVGFLLIASGVVRLARKGENDQRRASGDAAPAPRASDIAAQPSAAPPSAGSAPSAVAVGSEDAAASDVVVRARWGSGRGELGHDRPQEGNPEGPMSLAVVNGKLVVLDQVNRRIVRYDANGNVESVADAPATAQDVAVGKDGSTALLDRLSSKSITLLDPSGRKTGELSLEGTKAGDPGLVTGVFVDGKDVYVEKEHGAVFLVGTTEGSIGDGTQLAGRPSRDGTLLLHATMAQGRVVLNAIDRKTTTSRFARAIPFARPLRAIVLLDSDLHGTIYLGASAGAPNEAQIVCVEPTQGQVIGRLSVPASDTPEESFRDFSVDDDGTIVHAVRTDEGVTYSVAHCP